MVQDTRNQGFNALSKKIGGVTGTCMFCNRPLTDELSISLGAGSTCLRNMGTALANDLQLDEMIPVIDQFDMRTELGRTKAVEDVVMPAIESVMGTQNGAVLRELAEEGASMERMVETMCCGELADVNRALRDYGRCIASKGKWLPVHAVDPSDGAVAVDDAVDRIVDVMVLNTHFVEDNVRKALEAHVGELVRQFCSDGWLVCKNAEESGAEMWLKGVSAEFNLDMPMAVRKDFVKRVG